MAAIPAARDHSPLHRIATPLLVVLGAGLVGAFLIGYPAEDGNRAPAALVGGLFGLLIGFIVVAECAGSRRYDLERHIPIDPATIQLHAARWFGGPPWSLVRQQPGELVYWRRLEPSIVMAVLLLSLGIMPGVLSILSSRGTQTIALGVMETTGGAALQVLVQPQGHDGRRTVNRFFNSLHDIRMAPNPPTAAPANPGRTAHGAAPLR